MESKITMEEEMEAQQDSSNTSIFQHANRSVTLKFEDVAYTVKIKKSRGLFSRRTKKVEEKTILKGISGIVHPGEMLAMIGPSGSGKTTFLTALGGRLSGRLGGSITYNNKPFTNTMKRNIGFVTQDDVLYPHLTVTETLVYTALLRLPNSLTKAEKTAHAEAIITQLGLTRCKNSIVGGHFSRGVSGGERKRVSIGQEMLINPSLLFLDEPTSGLDSTTAQRIVSLLSDLAAAGRTVILTIHQPSTRIFHMFHKLLLLSEGNPVYFGKADVALEYFSGIGYAPSVAMNPSEFLLDLANGIFSDESQEDPTTVKHKLVSSFKASISNDLKLVMQEHNFNIQELPRDRKYPRWTTTWWQQFFILLQRGLKERKHESFSGLKVGQVIVVAFIAGLLWWQSKSIQDQIGMLFFQTGFWGYFPLFQAIFTFPQERVMLEKERSSGMYRLSSYFVARLVGDLPMELILPTVFLTITYWMAGLKRTTENFVFTLLPLLLSVLVSQGLGLALGAMVMDIKNATTLAAVIMLVFQLVGGYFIQNVPSFISWIKYVSSSQYLYKILLGVQYKSGETYRCGNNMSASCLVDDFPLIKSVGLGGQAVSVVVLVIMMVVYRAVAYLALMRIGRTKHK